MSYIQSHLPCGGSKGELNLTSVYEVRASVTRDKSLTLSVKCDVQKGVLRTGPSQLVSPLSLEQVTVSLVECQMK